MAFRSVSAWVAAAVIFILLKALSTLEGGFTARGD
jgi:hypothetical protein